MWGGAQSPGSMAAPGQETSRPRSSPEIEKGFLFKAFGAAFAAPAARFVGNKKWGQKRSQLGSLRGRRAEPPARGLGLTVSVAQLVSPVLVSNKMVMTGWNICTSKFMWGSLAELKGSRPSSLVHMWLRNASLMT